MYYFWVPFRCRWLSFNPALFSSRLPLVLLALFLAACQADPALVRLGLLTPTPTPDPYRYHRAILQPWAQQHPEIAGPLPRYHITAQLNKENNTLSGVMQVIIPRAESEIVFRLYPNLDHYNGSIEVGQALINGSPADITSLANGSAMQLELATPPEKPVTVDISFNVQIGTTPPDKDNYTLFGWDGPILSLPGFFPVLAVQQQGEWVLDTPPEHGDVLFAEAALYQLDLTLPSDLVAVSGGVTINVANNADGSRTWQMVGGPLRDMSVIAGPFQSISESAAGATVTSYYLPGHETNARNVLSHAAAAMRLYSDTFGPYPYTELDVVEAPLNYRGMEYSGLLLIGTNHYEDSRAFLTFLIAHEVAHQWWYSLVGNNPYQDPWLDEGLTEYSAFDYYRGTFGKEAAEELLTGRWLLPFDASANVIDGAVDQPAAEFDAVSYELLVYVKAALFFNAVRQQLGDELYRQVLQTYLEENRYKIVSPQTFLATAERVSGQNLNPLAEQWLR